MPKKTSSIQVATKSDIKLLKGDIQSLEKRMDEEFKNVDSKLDKIANTLDGFVGIVDNLRVENVVGSNQTRELREHVDDHEARITKLESPAV